MCCQGQSSVVKGGVHSRQELTQKVDTRPLRTEMMAHQHIYLLHSHPRDLYELRQNHCLFL